MQEYVEGQGFSVVREFVGHGIGREMHEDPKIPNFLSPDLRRRDIELVEGLVVAIEPMVNQGSPAVRVASDGWTVVTKDGQPSVHVEHTVAIVPDGADVLTR
jgi:methionyl aminopeptidase